MRVRFACGLDSRIYDIVVACLATASVGWYARDEFWTHLEGRSRGPICGKVRYEIEGGKEKQEHRHRVRIADLKAEIWTRDRFNIKQYWYTLDRDIQYRSSCCLIFRGVCKIPKGDNYRHVRPYGTSQLLQEGFSWNLIFDFFFFENCWESTCFVKMSQEWGALYARLWYLAKSLEWETFQMHVVEKIRTHMLCSVTFFRKLCRRWQYNTPHALYMLDN